MELDVARMARHRMYQEKYMPTAEEAFESFQDNLNNGESAQVFNTHHEDKRSFERAVSRTQVIEVLLNGYVIEAQRQDGQSFDMLIMSYVKITSGYRPLHVAIHLEKDICTVKTVYDPRSKREQWAENLETRLFYIEKCEKEEIVC